MPPKRRARKHDANTSGSSKKRKNLNSEGVLSTAAQKSLTNDDYTVGWISAITTEYVAAQSFLDAKHDRPEYVAPNDSNDYTLSRIGKHNVVIAVLPKGEYGIASASTVATQMLHSFKNVRIGLMVGIGGGAPNSKHDIRLGDIVVSTPYNKEGGVLQYTFGKAEQGREFKITKHLNQPPGVLRTAVSGLEAEYELSGHKFEKAINDILENNPRVKNKYKRPNPNADRLYLSAAKHPAKIFQANCDETCGSDASKLVPRDPRDQNEDNPAVYYGIIASADMLMKDALLRDKIAKEHDVLCFEMEAAGLMNHFPCLVIRGICDYSDSHKNKEWQGYAAMAAAAYAKDLLVRIPLSKIEAERRINDVLSSVEQNLHEIRGDVKALELEQRRAKLNRWLSPPDPSTNYSKALQQRQEGTGLWFLQSDAFATWKSEKNSFLWLYGIVGCGKTILSSTIIEHLESLPNKTLLYFYFDFTDAKKQTLRGVVCSLISQLYHTCKNAQESLDTLLLSFKDGNTKPSCESLCKVLSQMLERTEEVWIVLDAVDECYERKGHRTKGLLSWIQDLANSEQLDVHILVTSRPEQDIQLGLSSLVTEKDRIHIQNDLVSEDILAYIRVKVREGEGLERWQGYPEVQDEIEEGLAQKAKGMFRWVACQIEVLEGCLNYPDVRTALDSLPDSLEETYSRILNGIPDSHKPTAFRILQFLTYSERPLSIDEAVDAIAVDVDRNPHFCSKNRMPNPLEITRYCSSLVVVVSENNTEDQSDGYAELQLAHLSVKEFITSTRSDNDLGKVFRDTAASASIARVCIAYLLHVENELPLRRVRQSLPFAQYSARFWMDHERFAEGGEQENTDLIERLLCHQKHSYNLCYKLHQPDEPWKVWLDETRDRPASAIYYMAFGGLKKAVELLIDKGADVNAQGGLHGSALQAASCKGHEQIIKLLLNKGANVNAQRGHYGNALQAASYKGHKHTVKLLLNKGANINAQSGFYGNALQAASYNGHKQIVKLLLDKGANVNAQGGFYGNALQAASFDGHEHIVKLLVQRGAFT